MGEECPSEVIQDKPLSVFSMRNPKGIPEKKSALDLTKDLFREALPCRRQDSFSPQWHEGKKQHREGRSLGKKDQGKRILYHHGKPH